MTPYYNDDEEDWFEPLPENVEIGPNSYLYSAFAFRHSASRRPHALRTGAYTQIYANTCFDLGPDGEVILGDYVTLADPIISTNGRVEFGNHSMIGWDSVVADRPYALPPRSRSDEAGEKSADIVVGENVWVGARAVLLGGARIGDDSIVGAASVVDFEVPPGSIAAGNPARIVGPIEKRDR
jgi:acetyltransferase-like isoleucine patch superfamily enzyme